MRFRRRKPATSNESPPEPLAVETTQMHDSEPEALREPVVTRLAPNRDEARWKIIQAVNNFRYARHFDRLRNGPMFPTGGQHLAMPTPVLWGMRHIQEAVHIARRHELVDSDTLRQAGYRERNP